MNIGLLGRPERNHYLVKVLLEAYFFSVILFLSNKCGKSGYFRNAFSVMYSKVRVLEQTTFNLKLNSTLCYRGTVDSD